MVRKMLGVLAVAIAGLLAFGGASPAAAVPVYPPPPQVIVNVNITIIFIINGGTVIFSGSGFDGTEGVNITINYGGPSGLRNSPALAEATAKRDQTAATDANGNFSTQVQLTQVGTATLTATGLSSGRTGSLTVQVFEDLADYYGTNPDVDCADLTASEAQAIYLADTSDPN